MLLYFAQSEVQQWKLFGESMIQHIGDGQKEPFMKFMARLFASLKGINLITEDLAQSVLKALDSNFEALSEIIASGDSEDQEGESNEEGTQDLS